MLTIPPTKGVSITAALLLALCAQSQLTNMYYLWACPPFKKWGMVVPKPPRRIDYINLAQVVAQWICAVGYLLFCLDMRPREHLSIPLDPDNDPEWLLSLVTPEPPSPTPTLAYTSLAFHALLCVFWTYVAGAPTRDWLDLPFNGVMGLNACLINPVVTLITIYAMKLQIETTCATQGVSALTRGMVMMQAFVFLALAVSWPLRFKVPPNLKRGMGREYWIQEWFPLVGWACVNNGIIGVGLLVVALCSGGLDAERTSLLET